MIKRLLRIIEGKGDSKITFRRLEEKADSGLRDRIRSLESKERELADSVADLLTRLMQTEAKYKGEDCDSYCKQHFEEMASDFASKVKKRMRYAKQRAENEEY